MYAFVSGEIWQHDGSGQGGLSLERPRNGEPASEAGARILLVEDDATIQNMLADALRENGFQRRHRRLRRRDGPRPEREKSDLVLLDLMLPGEDGRAICARLRAGSPNLPIIMVTALGDDIDRIVGLEIGADDYVTKPFNTRELIARIRALLRRAARQRRRAHAPGAAALRRLGASTRPSASSSTRRARSSPRPAPSSTCCSPSAPIPARCCRASNCSI